MMGEFKQELRDGFIEACLHLINRDYDSLAKDFVTLGYHGLSSFQLLKKLLLWMVSFVRPGHLLQASSTNGRQGCCDKGINRFLSCLII